MTTITIQEKLEKRAEQKLDNMAAELYNVVSKNRIGTTVRFTVIRKKEDGTETRHTETLSSLIYRSCPEIEKAKESLLPEFINKETEDFMNRVESLSEEIDELKSNLS